MRPGHVPRLVLDPHSARGSEPEALGEGVGGAERRHGESPPVHGGHGLVELLDLLHVLGVGHPVGPGEVVGVEELPVADERVGLLALGESDPGRIQRPDHDVVDVVPGRRPRAPEGLRVVRRRPEAACGADDRGRKVRHPGGMALVRALNSPIISSHTGMMSRISRQ